MVNLARAQPASTGSRTQWPWVIKLNQPRWGDLLWQVLVECATMTAAVFVILAAGGLAGVYLALPALNQQSREAADAEVAAIIPTWDEAALYQAATPQFIDTAYNGYGRYFATLRRMGAGARNEGCQGRAIVNPTVLPSLITPSFVRWIVRPPPYSNLITAKYVCEIDTAAGGRAVAAIGLRRDKDAWRIASFYVSAPKLSRN